MKATAGFAGLGNMGAGMAQNLAAVSDLTVFDLATERAEAIRGAARVASSLEEVAAAGDVLLSLPGPPEVEAAAEVLLPAMKEGSMLVNLSTVSSSLIRDLERQAGELGIAVVDAPVTGAPDGAAAGTLTIMVGAEPEVYERARPLLEPFAGKLVKTGPVGSGTAAKLIVNMLWFTHIVALSDAVSVGVKAGVPAAVLEELIPSSAAGSWAAGHDLPTILSGDRGDGDVKFTIGLCNKDLRLIHALAEEFGTPTPVTDEARRRFEATEERFGPAVGEFAVVRLAEEASGAELRR